MPIFLQESFCRKFKKVTSRWGKIVPVGRIWKHSEKIDAITLAKCKEMNEYHESLKDNHDCAARVGRLDHFKPNLWELILSSVILDNPHGLPGYDDSEEDRLILWFHKHFGILCHEPSYQARIKQECENLYKTCIKETIKDGNNQLFEKIAELYSSYNHKIYGQQIASEVLECVLATWKSGDIHKLIYLAVNEEVCEAARKFSYEMAGIVRRKLKRPKEAEFVNLWVQDQYLGMNKILDISKRFPELAKTFRSGLAKIDVMFTLNLCLIFSCVPWIDKLKEINQESNSTNIC